MRELGKMAFIEILRHVWKKMKDQSPGSSIHAFLKSLYLQLFLKNYWLAKIKQYHLKNAIFVGDVYLTICVCTSEKTGNHNTCRCWTCLRCDRPERGDMS